jgi:hypothetical protein
MSSFAVGFVAGFVVGFVVFMGRVPFMALIAVGDEVFLGQVERFGRSLLALGVFAQDVDLDVE